MAELARAYPAHVPGLAIDPRRGVFRPSGVGVDVDHLVSIIIFAFRFERGSRETRSRGAGNRRGAC